MRPPARWPLHPQPAPGEALSSWLTRTAGAYGLRVDELLRENLGDTSLEVHRSIEDTLDVAPPAEFLDALQKRTGADIDQLRAMTLAGQIPWLFDSLEPSDDPEPFETYVHQYSVLLQPRSIVPRTTLEWRAWVPKARMRRACPACMEEPVQRFDLVWQLPVTLSCPKHGCYLETRFGRIASVVFWDPPVLDPQPAPAAVLAMDRRSVDALQLGSVQLSRRDVHAGVWFRLLRTILDELNTPPTHARKEKAVIAAVWERVGYSFRGGQVTWRPYDALDWAAQQKMLEAAAVAIAMIEEGFIVPAGPAGVLFAPVPQLHVQDGGRPRATGSCARGTELAVDYWRAAVDSLNEVVALARTDPATAASFYQLLLLGPAGPEEVRRLMTDAGIPDWQAS